MQSVDDFVHDSCSVKSHCYVTISTLTFSIILWTSLQPHMNFSQAETNCGRNAMMPLETLNLHQPAVQYPCWRFVWKLKAVSISLWQHVSLFTYLLSESSSGYFSTTLMMSRHTRPTQRIFFCFSMFRFLVCCKSVRNIHSAAGLWTTNASFFSLPYVGRCCITAIYCVGACTATLCVCGSSLPLSLCHLQWCRKHWSLV